MEMRKTKVLTILAWVHVWLLFAGIYAFAAGFLGLEGSLAVKFFLVSLTLLLPAAASWMLIRKTHALWQFLLAGFAALAGTVLIAGVLGNSFCKEAAEAILLAAEGQDGESRFSSTISPTFLTQLLEALTGVCTVLIFGIRGYVRIRKGQLKREAQEMPAGTMPLAEQEAWEIPTILDEPGPIHFIWFFVQYVAGVMTKNPFYWHTVFYLLFADLFLCFFWQYFDGMYRFIKDHQKIANLPVETMQKTGKLILRIAVLLLLVFVLPSVLYGKDPIAEAIAGYEPEKLTASQTELPEAGSSMGVEQMDLSQMLGEEETKEMPLWVQNVLSAVMYAVLVLIAAAFLYGIYRAVKNAGQAFSEEGEDEVLFLQKGSEERERIRKTNGEKEGFLSPNRKIRRYYKKTIRRGAKVLFDGTETPRQIEEKAGLSQDMQMERLHNGYEKARYSKEGCTKEEAEQILKN